VISYSEMGRTFMEQGRMYLNRWAPDFDPELDVPSAVSVWIQLPHLPLHCWNEESLRPISNSVGKYIHKSDPKAGMFACARNCVEVDL